MRKSAFLMALTLGVLIIAGCGSGKSTATTESLNPVERLWAQIVPAARASTAYEIPLSFTNTQRFIDWYNTIDLSAAQAKVREEALSPLVAPCCDEYPMSTCCCVCNLSRSVWGLSAYLIREKGYTAEQVQKSALQWLHFIRPDYYVARVLKEEGRYLPRYGVSTESSCFTNRCELPFYRKTGFRYIGGCGGMETLVPMENES